VGDEVAVGGIEENGVAVAVAVGGSEVGVDVATVAGPEVLVAVGKTVAEGGVLSAAHLSVADFLSFANTTVRRVTQVTFRLAFGSSAVVNARARASTGCRKPINTSVANMTAMERRPSLAFTT
jgi:hypothetical protein